eukprot:4244331-Pleurochrysis_carterae.AAC.1
MEEPPDFAAPRRTVRAAMAQLHETRGAPLPTPCLADMVIANELGDGGAGQPGGELFVGQVPFA